MRLDKYLADCGVESRRNIKRIVASGRVQINGQTVKGPKTQVTYQDQITLDGSPIRYRQYVYLMLNKPAGVLSATTDKTTNTVLDLLDEQWHRFDLFPVGRLDKDTVGLLILTNHGELAHRLLSPRYKVPKHYFACVDAPLTEEAVKAFSEGVPIGGEEIARPSELILSKRSSYEAEVVILEGKFHQVKRMFHAVGAEVTFLKRICFGGLWLDESLELGKYRPLTQTEIDSLFSVTGMTKES